MAAARDKSLMRSLGEFFGHIVKSVRTDVSGKKIVRKTVEKEQQGQMTVRRTTIEEIEWKKKGD